MTQDSQGMSGNDLPLLGSDCRLKLRKHHTLSVPPSNQENILSPHHLPLSLSYMSVIKKTT